MYPCAIIILYDHIRPVGLSLIISAARGPAIQLVWREVSDEDEGMALQVALSQLRHSKETNVKKSDENQRVSIILSLSCTY